MYALEGIRVLDVGQFLAGPFADMILADLGAEVIKVEPVEGDAMRSGRPFLGCQRGKRDIAVNLKSDEGINIFYDLVRSADVIHHNMRVGVAERLRLDYATLRKIKPDLIYNHSPAYGVSGPRATWPGFDQLYQSSTGCEYEQGAVHLGNDPVWYRFGMCDTGNAMQVVVAVTTALLHRQRTGEGGFSHTSLLNAGGLFNSANFLTQDGPVPRPRQNQSQTGTGPDNRLYQTSDGWVQVCAGTDAAWGALTTALRLGDAARDAATEAQIATAMAAMSARDAWALLDAAGVPAEISRDTNDGLDGVLRDQELFDLGIISEYEHPNIGTMRQFGHLITFDDTPGHIQRPPPLAGQHTQEILAELGFDAGQIDALHSRGVVYSPDEHYAERFAI